MGRQNKDLTKRHIILLAVLTVVLLATLGVLLWQLNPAVLTPSGTIAARERELILLAVGLGAVVVLPVFIMLFVVAWRYREGNNKAKYTPEWQSNRLVEGLWWGIPLIIISVLGVVAWQTSHELDPFRPLDSHKKPVTIQVVALQWRWLFIYPDEKIATLNELYAPVDTPINFQITADAPMNSFWIPKLGSQVYAMPGMSTKLHLQASEVGKYRGSSANISGQGFAGMTFTAHILAQQDYQHWLAAAKQSKGGLDKAKYSEIANPSKDTSPSVYVLKKPGLYDTIVEKYMGNTGTY